MSWQLVSFLILAVVLLGGFAWYERSRPPAQVVALVAALAALAIAGRIAFAAFPNVKPTTDIVIFAGYALGAGAGLRGRRARRAGLQLLVRAGTVDAVADGRLGALRRSSARRWRCGARNVGRLTLAAVCGLAAVGYGAILNFSLMATYGGDLSWAALLVLESHAQSLRSRPRDRQHRLRPGRRPGDDPDAGPLPRTFRMERSGPARCPAGRRHRPRSLPTGGVAVLLAVAPARRLRLGPRRPPPPGRGAAPPGSNRPRTRTAATANSRGRDPASR